MQIVPMPSGGVVPLYRGPLSEVGRWPLHLGRCMRTGRTVVLPYELRELNQSLRAVSGSGKTELIKLVLAQDIAELALGARKSLVIVDHIGHSANFTRRVVAHLIGRFREEARRGESAARREFAELAGARLEAGFRWVDLTDPNCTETCNPLRVCEATGRTVSVVADDLRLWAEAMGRGDMSQTKRLARNLACFGQVVALAGGNLVDAVRLSYASRDELVALLRQYESRLSEFARLQLRRIVAFDGQRFVEQVASTSNSLGQALEHDKARRFFLTRRGSVDFHDVVNTPGITVFKLPRELVALMGSFVVQMVLREAFRRPEGTIDPRCVVFVDEWQEHSATEHFASYIPVSRNVGCTFVCANQLTNQPPLHTPDGKGVMDALAANSIQILGRQGWDDAVRSAAEVFPFGYEPHLERRRYVDVTESENSSESDTFTRAVAKAFSRTRNWTLGSSKALGRSLGVATGRAESVSVGHVASLGLSLSSGGSHQRSTCSQTGTALTWMHGRLYGEAIAVGSGTTDAHGTSNGMSEGFGSGATQFLSNGRSMPVLIEGGHETQNLGCGSGTSSNRNSSTSHGQSFNHAVSNFFQKAQSLGSSSGQGGQTSSSTSRTEGDGTNEAEALTESAAESLAEVMGIHRAVSEALNLSDSRSRSVGEGDSESDTETHSDSHSVMKGRGSSRREVVEHYTLSEQLLKGAERLFRAGKRVFFLISPEREKAEVIEFMSADLPRDAFPTRYGDIDLEAELVAARRAPAEDPPPSIFDGHRAPGLPSAAATSARRSRRRPANAGEELP